MAHTANQATVNHSDKADGVAMNQRPATGRTRTGNVTRPKRETRIALNARPDADMSLGNPRTSHPSPRARIAAPPTALDGPGRSMARPSAIIRKLTRMLARATNFRVKVSATSPHGRELSCEGRAASGCRAAQIEMPRLRCKLVESQTVQQSFGPRRLRGDAAHETDERRECPSEDQQDGHEVWREGRCKRRARGVE